MNILKNTPEYAVIGTAQITVDIYNNIELS